MGIKLDSRSKSLFTPSFPLEVAKELPIPAPNDVFNRYCHSDPHPMSRLRVVRYTSLLEYDDRAEGDLDERELERTAMLYGHCDEDSDCDELHPFCVNSVCRECRESEDCPSPALVCSSQTGFTCSECESNEDCSGDICRFGFNQTSFASHLAPSTKQCSHCPSHIPEAAQIIDPARCSWRCPIDMHIDSLGDCSICPACSDNQFYSSALSKSSFLTTCTNATQAVCGDCSVLAGIPGPDDKKFCAKIKSPTMPLHADPAVGDLGPNFPCRYFTCNSGWFLDLSVNKCRQCHYSMCTPGQRLEGCGDEHPGRCVPCSGQKPKSASWAAGNEQGCTFMCPKGSEYDEDEGECVRCRHCDGSTVYTLAD